MPVYLTSQTRRWSIGDAAGGEPTALEHPGPSETLHRSNEHPSSNNPFSATAPVDGGPPSDAQESSSDSKHVFYAVELFIFAFVGWGWLAIREYLGKTPVMDVVVVISVMVCSILNLAMALSTPSPREFEPSAHAYVSHCLVLWVVYVYSLSESTRLDTGTLCCVDAAGSQGSSFSAGPTHAAAFFGGLPMHQVPGVVTVAYLTVVLLVAGAQARACTLHPKDWEVRGLGLSITALVAIHLGVYLIGVPLCNNEKALGAVSVIAGVIAVILMLDYDWVMGEVIYSVFLRHARSDQQRRDHRLLRSSIQAVGLVFILLFCLTVALGVEKSLSIPLLIVFLVSVVVYILALANESVTLYGSKILGIEKWTPPAGTESRARFVAPRGRIAQGMHVPSLLTRGRSVDSTEGPFLRRYPLFLQGQANRGKKSY